MSQRKEVQLAPPPSAHGNEASPTASPKPADDSPSGSHGSAKPTRIQLPGPSPREEAALRASPRKPGGGLTPRKTGAGGAAPASDDHFPNQKVATPRRAGGSSAGVEPAAGPKTHKPKHSINLPGGGFFSSLFTSDSSSAGSGSSAVPATPSAHGKGQEAERAEAPSASTLKVAGSRVAGRRPGSGIINSDQLNSVREGGAEGSWGRASSPGISSSVIAQEGAKDSPRANGKTIAFGGASPGATLDRNSNAGQANKMDPWKAKQVKSAGLALSAELALLHQFKLKERTYAQQMNAATPFHYLDLSPEDIEILMKTPRSASSASSASGDTSSGIAAPPPKLDPTSWAKWHLEMSERVKERKAQAAAQLLKSQAKVRSAVLGQDGRRGAGPPSLQKRPGPGSDRASKSGEKEKERQGSAESEPVAGVPVSSSGSTSPRSPAITPSPAAASPPPSVSASPSEDKDAALARAKSGKSLKLVEPPADDEERKGKKEKK